MAGPGTGSERLQLAPSSHHTQLGESRPRRWTSCHSTGSSWVRRTNAMLVCEKRGWNQRGCRRAVQEWISQSWWGQPTWAHATANALGGQIRLFVQRPKVHAVLPECSARGLHRALQLHTCFDHCHYDFLSFAFSQHFLVDLFHLLVGGRSNSQRPTLGGLLEVLLEYMLGGSVRGATDGGCYPLDTKPFPVHMAHKLLFLHRDMLEASGAPCPWKPPQSLLRGPSWRPLHANSRYAEILLQ